jgi:hypothetical protein
MSDQHDGRAANHPQSLPSLFTLHHAVLNAQRVRIFEHQLRRFEADPMFRAVCPVLSFVPLETN